MSKVQKRSDGRYMLRFTVEGKRYTVYGATAKECKQKELEKRREIEEGLTGSAKNYTVEKWLMVWSESREQRLTGSSIRTNNQHLRRACRQQIGGTKFGNIKLQKLEVVDVRKLQNVLAEQFTTRTVNDTISFLKQGIEAAVNERLINWNPCRAVEALRRTEEAARDTTHRCLDRDEVEAFLEHAKESRYTRLYSLLLQTGLRIGEATAFSPSDVHGDQLNVHKTVTREETGYIVREQTKTEAGRRVVPLTEQARTAIKAEMKIQERLTGSVRIDAPVFQNSQGGLIVDSVVNEDIERVCKRAGIEKFTAHAFRATFISRCVESGMNIKELMEIAGHKDVKMTLALYAHSNTESRTESLKKVAII